MSSPVVHLAELLRRVRRPGDFCMRGSAELLAPSLSVEGVGQVALPLQPEQARRLIAAAERAPYGRGSQTIIDTAVRNSWQIGPDRARLAGRHWPRTLAGIVAMAAEGLGVEEPVEAEFYKLLIYETGSFFVSHRDTEKSPGMFATLVIVLPSDSAGGELVVRHKERSVRFDLRCEDPAEAVFSAFYADCPHEVLPVTAGCRLTLVYNLLRRGRGRAPLPPNYSSEQAEVAALLGDWRAAMDGIPGEGTHDQKDEDGDEDDPAMPQKLVYPLEHAYTAPELEFAALKGADAAAAGVLAAAARQADCALHLAVVTLEQSGSAEYGENYGRRRRWSEDADEDDGQFEVGEIHDWTIALSDWRAPDGEPVSWGEIPVLDSELSPPDPFDDLKPDELHFQEASGNEGVSFERRYRRAALVVWPNDRALAVLTQAGLGVTVPHLRDLAGRWEAAGSVAGSPDWRQAHELAGHMIDRWPEQGGRGGSEVSEAAAMLAALTKLGDTARIDDFLTRVVASGRGYAQDKDMPGDNAAIVAALALFPPDAAGALVRAVVAGNAARRFAACAHLLAQCPPILARHDALREAAGMLFSALPGRAAGIAAPSWSPRTDRVEAGFVADLLIAFAAIFPGLADRAVTHMLDHPKTFDMDTILVPAARDRLRAPAIAAHKAVARLIAACLAHLRARIARPLAPPADWQRADTLGCRCVHCTALSRFLADPAQPVWVFRAVAADRGHVEGTIRAAQCDVDTTTEQRGRPYSLICKKNQASYQRRVVQRAKDLRDAASLAG
jgi:predicted 2-oxoglutarate/Fe(II)-dependent dioxygenase YbiX